MWRSDVILNEALQPDNLFFSAYGPSVIPPNSLNAISRYPCHYGPIQRGVYNMEDVWPMLGSLHVCLCTKEILSGLMVQLAQYLQNDYDNCSSCTCITSCMKWPEMVRLLCIFSSWIWRMLSQRGGPFCSVIFSGLQMIKKVTLFVCERTASTTTLQPPADTY